MATFFRNKCSFIVQWNTCAHVQGRNMIIDYIAGGKSFENYSSSRSHSTTAGEHQRRKCTSFFFTNSLIIHGYVYSSDRTKWTGLDLITKIRTSGLDQVTCTEQSGCQQGEGKLGHYWAPCSYRTDLIKDQTTLLEHSPIQHCSMAQKLSRVVISVVI